MSEWFTADPHFGHANIIEHCDRPFSTIEEMDEGIIDIWNAQLSPGDRLFILGDFCGQRRSADYIASYVDRIRLHPGNITLILGNHDNEKACRKVFPHVHHLYTFGKGRRDRQKIVLCHYSMRSWNGLRHGRAWHLYGHWHGDGPPCPWGMSFDCGVDTNGFKLYSYDQVEQVIATLPKANSLAESHGNPTVQEISND